MQMRIVSYLIVAFLLEGCSSDSSRSSEGASNSRVAAECIVREAKTIAPMKVDLETAASAVIARCSAYTDAIRRSLVARYPGHRDYIETQTREVDALYLEQARRAVAVARTSQ
jgi:hypothetical protein